MHRDDRWMFVYKMNEMCVLLLNHDHSTQDEVSSSRARLLKNEIIHYANELD